MVTKPNDAIKSELRDPETHPAGSPIQGKVYELKPESSGQVGIISAWY